MRSLSWQRPWKGQGLNYSLCWCFLDSLTQKVELLLNYSSVLLTISDGISAQFCKIDNVCVCFASVLRHVRVRLATSDLGSDGASNNSHASRELIQKATWYNMVLIVSQFVSWLPFSVLYSSFNFYWHLQITEKCPRQPFCTHIRHFHYSHPTIRLFKLLSFLTSISFCIPNFKFPSSYPRPQSLHEGENIRHLYLQAWLVSF